MGMGVMARGAVSGLLAAGLMWGGSQALGQATTIDAPRSASPAEPKRERDERGIVQGPTRVGWWNDGVFYQVFVRSFQDSTEGPLAGDGIGDFRGLMSRLDYLNDGDPTTTTDLGVTGIWLMPIHPSPSYHGYDITDYRAVRDEYGTMEDFRAFMAACRARGIRVILDLVLNHCSWEHAWFQEALEPGSAKRDWFVWSESDPGYRGPWNQQVWHRSPQGGGYYYGVFYHGMPDLNFRNAEVSAEMLNVVRFWLTGLGDGLGVDGYRLDAIRHLVEDGAVQDNTPGTYAWLEEFYREYKRSNPEAVAVGEVWASTEVAASYVGGRMDLAFEFDLGYAMVDAARQGNAARIKSAQEKVLRLYPPNQYGRFLTNHDQTRVATELGNDAGKMRVAASMLLTGPGVPFVYYGEEIGQPGSKPDPELRTPMAWTGEISSFTSGTPWKDRYPAGAGITVAAQTDDPTSLLSHYRRLIALRREVAALSHGAYVGVSASDPAVYAFMRVAEDGGTGQGGGGAALVVINLGARAVESVTLRPDEMVAAGGMIGRDRLGAAGEGAAIEIGAEGARVDRLGPHETRVYVLEERR